MIPQLLDVFRLQYQLYPHCQHSAAVFYPNVGCTPVNVIDINFSKSKMWLFTLIVANPYQDGGTYAYSVYYGWCTRPFPHPNTKGKKQFG